MMCGECNWPMDILQDFQNKIIEQISFSDIREAIHGDDMKQEIPCPVCGDMFIKKTHNHVRCLDCTNAVGKEMRKLNKLKQQQKLVTRQEHYGPS